MKTQYVILIIFGLLVIMNSCKEEFDYNQMTEGLERIVVEAYIIDVDSVHTFKIMKSSDFIDPQSPVAATNAVVSVYDGENSYDFSETSPGIYQNHEYFFGEVGKTYILNIIYENKKYESKSLLNASFDIDLASVIWQDSINYVFLSGQEPSQKGQFYLLKISKNGVLNDTITNWSYFDDELMNGIYLNYELVYMLEGSENDSLEIVLSSISREMSDYFISIVNNIGFEPDPFFSTTPANFKGNISNGGLGFFQASSVRKQKCVRL